MKLKGGYFFKILEVDLTTGTSSVRPFGEDFALKYIGGRGFGARILADHLKKKKKIDPLGPDNILLLSCGLLTGTAAPASARLHINARSPLTGLLGSSNIGGNFGAKLRSCGIQSLVIRGKSPEPVYLWL